MPRWRNWYTRTFEGRMRQLIRVQVPAWAPLSPDPVDRRPAAGRPRPPRYHPPRAVSSAGQSASLTPRMSEVRVLTAHHLRRPSPDDGPPVRVDGAPCTPPRIARGHAGSGGLGDRRYRGSSGLSSSHRHLQRAGAEAPAHRRGTGPDRSPAEAPVGPDPEPGQRREGLHGLRAGGPRPRSRRLAPTPWPPAPRGPHDRPRREHPDRHLRSLFAVVRTTPN